MPRYGGTRDDFARLLHPDDASRSGRAWDEALAGGRPYALDFRIVKTRRFGAMAEQSRHRGARCHRSITAYRSWSATSPNGSGRQKRRCGIRAPYRRLHDSIRDALVVVDLEGRICRVECRYRDREMLGYYRRRTGAAHLCGVDARALARDGSASSPKRFCGPGRPASTKGSTRRRRDGVNVTHHIRTPHSPRQLWRPYRMWAIVRDITERTRAEAASRARTASRVRCRPVPTSCAG